MIKRPSVSATLRVELSPWEAPNFARRVGADDSDITAVHVSDLDDDALEDLALAWVRELYTKAKRTHCPFYKPVKEAPRR